MKLMKKKGECNENKRRKELMNNELSLNNFKERKRDEEKEKEKEKMKEKMKRK
jgi:hypothetical protein